MAGLPASLAIALWFVGSMWLVAIVAYASDAAPEIVLLTFIAGLGAACVEWWAIGGGRR
jgi:hypothetical protein